MISQGCGIPGVHGEFRKPSPSPPVNSWKWPVSLYQHEKMVLCEAFLVSWFANNHHQSHYGDLARQQLYWKGERRAESCASDQEKEARRGRGAASSLVTHSFPRKASCMFSFKVHLLHEAFPDLPKSPSCPLSCFMRHVPEGC